MGFRGFLFLFAVFGHTAAEASFLPGQLGSERCSESFASDRVLKEIRQALRAEGVDREHHRVISKNDKEILALQKSTGMPKRAVEIAHDGKLAYLRSLVVSGHEWHAFDQIRQQFIDVELLHIAIRKNEARLKELLPLQVELESDSFTGRAKRLLTQTKKNLLVREIRSQIKKDVIAFGKLYGEYTAIRQHLEETLRNPEGKNPLILTRLDKVVKWLGITTTPERTYPSLVGTSPRPTMAEIRETFESHPLAIITKQEVDKRLQRLHTFTSFVFAVVNASRTLIADNVVRAGAAVDGLAGWVSKKVGDMEKTFDPKIRYRMKWVLQWFYNMHARREHFPRIATLLEDGRAPEEKISLLLEYSTNDPSILFTFARRLDAQDLWDKMRAVADDKAVNAKSGGHKSDEYIVLSRGMKEAEGAADVMGYLAVYDPGNSVARNTAAGVAFTSTLYGLARHYDKVPENIAHIVEIVTYYLGS